MHLFPCAPFPRLCSIDETGDKKTTPTHKTKHIHPSGGFTHAEDVERDRPCKVEGNIRISSSRAAVVLLPKCYDRLCQSGKDPLVFFAPGGCSSFQLFTAQRTIAIAPSNRLECASSTMWFDALVSFRTHLMTNKSTGNFVSFFVREIARRSSTRTQLTRSTSSHQER